MWGIQSTADAETSGESLQSDKFFYGVKVLLHNIVTNCKWNRGNFIVEEPGRQYLIPVIKVNITSNGRDK